MAQRLRRGSRQRPSASRRAPLERSGHPSSHEQAHVAQTMIVRNESCCVEALLHCVALLELCHSMTPAAAPPLATVSSPFSPSHLPCTIPRQRWVRRVSPWQEAPKSTTPVNLEPLPLKHSPIGAPSRPNPPAARPSPRRQRSPQSARAPAPGDMGRAQIDNMGQFRSLPPKCSPDALSPLVPPALRRPPRAQQAQRAAEQQAQRALGQRAQRAARRCH